MTFDVIRLEFNGPLHLNSGKDDYGSSSETLHSDTIYAAIISMMVRMGIEPNPTDLGFTISSAFPYYKSKSDSIRYFFPKVQFPFNRDNLNANPNLAKQVKSTAWLEQELFEKTMNGELSDVDQISFSSPFAWSGDMDIPPVYKSKIMSRNRIREDAENRTQIYYVDRLVFQKGSGFFLLCFLEDESKKEMLKQAFDLLGDQGIGSDRSVGFGQFQAHWDQIELNLPNDSDTVSNMSFFLPDNKDSLASMLWPGGSFQPIKRGGWLTEARYSTYRKRSIYMLQEGGVFKKPVQSINEVPVFGSHADLKPEILENEGHPVWRVGKAIFLPVKVFEDNEIQQ